MKKLTALLIAIIMLIGLAACSPKDKPIFETENITGVTFISTAPNGRETVVPVEYLGEITRWLGSFKVGKKAGDVLPPGADSLFVRIEYSDGTIVENSMSTVVIKDTTYIINHDKEPDCYFALFQHPNKVIYDRALNCIPAAADASLDDILVKSIDFCYSADGTFEGGSLTVWRYNDTVEGVDLWTQGIITITADGAVTFEVEHEEIRLFSEYSPKTDRSLIPVAEIFDRVSITDMVCVTADSSTVQHYRLTLGNEEHIAYVASADTGVDYYDNFDKVQKPAELTAESYTVNGRYYFILTVYSADNADAESWTVYMFEK